MKDRRGILATIHCARRDLGLDEETYRALLERVAGKRSAKDCTDAQLGRIVDELRRRGWRPKPRGRVSPVPHVRKVWAIWGEMCRSGIVRTPTRAALRAFVERMTGVTDPEWLTPQQTNVVVEGLKAWRVRELARIAEGKPDPGAA